jgi:hypothetical protein
VAWAQYFLGQIWSSNGHAGLDGARTAYESGLAEARALCLRPLVARFELGLGQLHRRTREDDLARTYLSNAVASLREMQMPHWLHQAETELQRVHADTDR